MEKVLRSREEDKVLNARILKRNLIGLYISCIGGFTEGLGDFQTNIQSFLNVQVGEWSIILMKMFFYLAAVGMIVIAPILTHRKCKKILFPVEVLDVIVYTVLFYIMYNKINLPYVVLILCLISIMQKKLSDILWAEYELRVIPMERRQKYYGNVSFLTTVGIVVGMYASTWILKLGEGIAYIYMFGIIAAFGLLMLGAFIYLDESNVCIVGENEKVTLKDSINEWKRIVSNKEYWTLFASKLFSNLGFAIVFLYTYFAIKDGNSPAVLAELGTIYWISFALSGLVWGYLKITYSGMLMWSRIIVIISYLVFLVTKDYYLTFMIYPIAMCGNEIANINLIGILGGEEDETDLIAAFYSLDFIAALAIGLFTFIVTMYTQSVGIVLAIAFLLIAIKITIDLKKMEIYHLEQLKD